MTDGATIDPASFAQAMRGFAPFEARPAIAVAVSGGPDSLALLLLVHRWAADRGGFALGLTVDHRLRPQSTDEAAQVGAWAAARGIAHTVLRWTGEKPNTGIQAAARQARYALLSQACAERGILHLALAHHADDQAETVLFRQDRNSGPAGMAGMTASRSLGAVRLIRPLLGWRKAALIATCRHAGQDFIEDPSNRADRFARSSLRRRLAADPNLRRSLLNKAADAAFRRAEADTELAVVLGRIAEARPDGVVLLERDAYAALEPAPRRAALAATLRTAGGQAFAPDADALNRLDEAVLAAEFAGASLGGCVVRLWRGRLLVCREPKRTAPPVVLTPGAGRRWDGRFHLRISAGQADLTVGRLGAQAFAALRKIHDVRLPAIAGAGLPAVRANAELICVPSLGWTKTSFVGVEQQLSPLWPLSSETFTVVSAGQDIMSV